MVAQVGNITLALQGGKSFISQAVMKQHTEGVVTNTPKVGKVLTKFPKKLLPTLVNIPLGKFKKIRGTYKDHLKQSTNQTATYKVKVYIITDTDLTPEF